LNDIVFIFKIVQHEDYQMNFMLKTIKNQSVYIFFFRLLLHIVYLIIIFAL